MRTILSIATFTLLLPSLPAQEAGDAKGPEARPVEAAAQGMPKPAPELKKLVHMIGSWTGKGDSYEGPGKPSMPWTAEMDFRWGYDGHWVVENSRIIFGGDQPDLHFRAFWGWDRENKRYVTLGMNNMGEIIQSEFRLKEDGTLIWINDRMQMGQRHVSRSIAQFGKEKGAFRMYEAVDDEKEFLHVEGEYVRSKQELTIPMVKQTFPFPLPTKQVDKIAGMCGSYTMKGEWSQAPGAPAMPISGTERIHKVYGGLMLAFESRGDEMPGMDWRYEGFAAMGWDANRNCYSMIYVNNMGQHNLSRATYDPSSRKVVFVDSGFMEGKLSSTRNILELGEDGTILRCKADALSGVHEAFVPFTAVYERIKGS
jgi:hypothetical protein